MEIHALKILISEAEVTSMALQVLPEDFPLRQFQVRLTEAGARIRGAYPLLISIPFETRWTLSVQHGKIAARLVRIKVIGISAGALKGMLMGAMAQAAAREDALQIDGDTVLFDLDRLLASRGFPSRTNLTAVHCEVGQLWVEASNSEPG